MQIFCGCMDVANAANAENEIWSSEKDWQNIKTLKIIYKSYNCNKRKNWWNRLEWLCVCVYYHTAKWILGG